MMRFSKVSKQARLFIFSRKVQKWTKIWRQQYFNRSTIGKYLLAPTKYVWLTDFESNMQNQKMTKIV